MATTETVRLTASDGVDGDEFGNAVAVSGDGRVVVVGARKHGPFTRGKVYVYSGDGLATETILTASDAANGDSFGWSVATNEDGSIIVVGAAEADGNVGKVYVYSGPGWADEQIFTTPVGGSFYGISVAISSDGLVIAVGSYGSDSSDGRAYLYTGTGYAVETLITASDGLGSGQFFGSSVSLSADGTVLAVGTGDAFSTFPEKAYVYSGTSWATETILTPSDGGGTFGFQVAVSRDGTTVVTGAMSAQQAYVYTGAGWVNERIIIGPAGSFTFYGRSIAVTADGDTLVVGTPDAPDNVTDLGAAYLYQGFVANPTSAALLAAHPELLVAGWSPTHDYSADLVAAGWGAPGGNSDLIQFLIPTGVDAVFVAEVNGGLTDSVEPDWSTAPSPGDTVTDGGLTWTNAGPPSGFPDTATAWQATNPYGPPWFARPVSGNGHIYIWYPPPGNSGGSEPVFPTDGNYVSDGDSYWLDAPDLNAAPTDTLTASDAATGDRLGNAISISDDGAVIAIAAPDSHEPGERGAVYVYGEPTTGPTTPVQTRDAHFWKFIVADLRTTRTLTAITTLMTDVSVVRALYESWPAALTVPSDDPRIRTTYDGDTFDEPFVAEGVRCLIGFRDTGLDPLWEVAYTGLILQVNDAVEDGIPLTHISAWDLRKYLEYVPVCKADGTLPGKKGLTFTSTKANEIARALLDNLMAGDWGDLVSTLLDTSSGDDEDCAEITINFAQGTSIADAWAQLEQTGAIDIVLLPLYDPAGRPGKISTLNFYTQAGQERPAAIFGWDRSPRSLTGISRLEDGTKRANVIQFFDSKGKPATPQSDSTAIAKYGPYVGQQSLVDQSEGVAVDLLALLQKKLRKNGRTVVSIEPTPQRAAQPIQGYDIGDRVRVEVGETLRKPISEFARIYSIPFDIGQDAAEAVTSLGISADGVT